MVILLSDVRWSVDTNDSFIQGLMVFAWLTEERYIAVGQQLKLKTRFDPETNIPESDSDDEDVFFNSAEKLLM